MLKPKPIPGLDDFWYYVNIGRIISLVKLAILPCKRGNRFATVQYRCEWGKSSRYIVHLHRHGVPTFYSLLDSKYSYFSVRKSQQNWAEYLMTVDRKNNHVSGIRVIKGKTWNQQRTGKIERVGKFAHWFFQ